MDGRQRFVARRWWLPKSMVCGTFFPRLQAVAGTLLAIQRASSMAQLEGRFTGRPQLITPCPISLKF
jgi:hypothetical protein